MEAGGRDRPSGPSRHCRDFGAAVEGGAQEGGGGENPVVPKAAAWSVSPPHITFPSLLDEGTSARILSETIYKREAGDTAAASPPSGAVLIAAKLV